MENLVVIQNAQAVTSSRKIAEVFEKRHDHVLRDIENVIKGLPKIGDTPEMFRKTIYKNVQNGQEYTEYLMNRDGFTLLAMGFTGSKAMKFKIAYIQAFNEMEKQLAGGQDSYMIADPVERALRWAEEEKKRQALAGKVEEQNLLLAQKDQEIGELKPKADYVDSILRNRSLMTITQIAKDYGMSGQAMNDLLHQYGIQYKQGSQWLLYSKYHAKGYTSSETIEFTRSDGRKDVKLNTKWTQKGRLFLYETLKADGIVPIIEQEEVA